MGTPEFATSWSEVGVPWGSPNLQLVCEVRAACWGQWPELAESTLTPGVDTALHRSTTPSLLHFLLRELQVSPQKRIPSLRRSHNSTLNPIFVERNVPAAGTAGSSPGLSTPRAEPHVLALGSHKSSHWPSVPNCPFPHLANEQRDGWAGTASHHPSAFSGNRRGPVGGGEEGARMRCGLAQPPQGGEGQLPVKNTGCPEMDDRSLLKPRPAHTLPPVCQALG